MSTNKTEYRIEVWQDEWNGSAWTETKVVTIGANDMDFLGKARNPILKIDVNGENSETVICGLAIGDKQQTINNYTLIYVWY